MRAFAAPLACLVLVACAGVEMKPGERSHARREIPPGPGILTGEEGEFVIFRRGEKPGAESKAGEGAKAVEEQGPEITKSSD